jgi:hypothetical protein
MVKQHSQGGGRIQKEAWHFGGIEKPSKIIYVGRDLDPGNYWRSYNHNSKARKKELKQLQWFYGKSVGTFR